MKLKTSTGIIIGIILVVGLAVIGYMALPKTQTQPSNTGTKFVQYAQQLGLNETEFAQCMNSGDSETKIADDVNSGKNYGVQGTPTLFVNGQELLGVSSYMALQSAIQSALAMGQKNNITLGVNPPRGNASAPVVIVEFSDYQCPACGAAEPLIEKAAQDYSGTIVLYYRNFPLTTLHPYAERAAEAAQCAGDQGKFWEYHDTLFANQQEWTSG